MRIDDKFALHISNYWVFCNSPQDYPFPYHHKLLYILYTILSYTLKLCKNNLRYRKKYSCSEMRKTQLFDIRAEEIVRLFLCKRWLVVNIFPMRGFQLLCWSILNVATTYFVVYFLYYSSNNSIPIFLIIQRQSLSVPCTL